MRQIYRNTLEIVDLTHSSIIMNCRGAGTCKDMLSLDFKKRRFFVAFRRKKDLEIGPNLTKLGEKNR